MSESMKESLKAVENAAILIPSLEPDERLPAYIRKLSENGFGKIIVVDDGSSELYQPIFREVESIDRAVVLHHGLVDGEGSAHILYDSTYVDRNSWGCRYLNCRRDRKRCISAAAISRCRTSRRKAAAATGSLQSFSNCCTDSTCRTHKQACVHSGKKNCRS